MDDLISKQDAVDALWKLQRELQMMDLDNGKVISGVQYSIKRIENIQPAQQWILCSERLPEDDTEVLVSTAQFVYMAELVTHDGNRLWEEAEGHWILACVTAWMPLPKPYKAPDQERDCEHCVHHTDKGCSSWNCKFERRQ